MPLNSDLHSETQRLPRIGEKAPFFKGQSTQGEITLDDYKNDWVILFAHPADFTPVCTSEFVALQNQYSEFQDLGVKLVGLSVDSLASHVAWLNSIEESFDVQIEFPLISDANKVISETYGMLAPESNNTESSRAVFIIDDDAVVRAMIYYPMTTGRNIDELLRVTRAMKTSDETGDNTPTNWKKGDNLLAAPPETLEDAKKRMKDSNYDCKNWYYCEKDDEQNSKKFYNPFLYNN